MTHALAERDVWVAGASAVVAAVSLSLAFGLRPPTSTEISSGPAVASVKEAVGAVKTRPVSTLGWRDAQRGLEVHDGDAVFVPPGAAATLRFVDGTELAIDERSLVVIERPRSGVRNVALRQGSLSGVAGGTALTVSTPAGDARLDPRSEAHFAVEGKALQVAVRKGTAEVKHQRLEGGQRATAAESGTRVLEAWPVTLEAPEPQAHLMFHGAPPPVELRWKGAGARVQLARDRLFAFIETDAAVTGPRFTVETCARGVTWWRVVDPEGQPVSEARRFSCVEDVAPVALAPLNGEVVLAPPGTNVGFSWTPLAGVTRYRLEFSATDDFKVIVATQQVQGTGARVALRLDEASWFWRVRADDDTESTSPSKPLRFRVIHKGIPEAPELLTPQIEVTP